MSIKFCFQNEIYETSEIPQDFASFVQILQETISTKFPAKFTIGYQDSEGDKVIINNEEGYKLALESEISNNEKTLNFFINDVLEMNNTSFTTKDSFEQIEASQLESQPLDLPPVAPLERKSLSVVIPDNKTTKASVIEIEVAQTPASGVAVLEVQKAEPQSGVAVLEVQKAEPQSGVAVLEVQRAEPQSGVAVLEVQKAEPQSGVAVLEVQKAEPLSGVAVLEVQRAEPQSGIAVLEVQRAEPQSGVAVLEVQKVEPLSGVAVLEVQKVEPLSGVAVLEIQKAEPLSGVAVLEVQKVEPMSGVIVLEVQSPTSGIVVLEVQRAEPLSGVAILEVQQAEPLSGVAILDVQKAEPQSGVAVLEVQKAEPLSGIAVLDVQKAEPLSGVFVLEVQSPTSGVAVLEVQKAEIQSPASGVVVLEVQSPASGVAVLEVQKAEIQSPVSGVTVLSVQKASNNCFAVQSSQIFNEPDSGVSVLSVRKAQNESYHCLDSGISILSVHRGSKRTKKAKKQAIHTEVMCDACGAFPIIGNRYKCLVLDNYDLCSDCKKTTNHPYPLIEIKDESQYPYLSAVYQKEKKSLKSRKNKKAQNNKADLENIVDSFIQQFNEVNCQDAIDLANLATNLIADFTNTIETEQINFNGLTQQLNEEVLLNNLANTFAEVLCEDLEHNVAKKSDEKKETMTKNRYLSEIIEKATDLLEIFPHNDLEKTCSYVAQNYDKSLEEMTLDIITAF